MTQNLIVVLAVSSVLMWIAMAVVWLRMNRPMKEDPRLSRGLQLMQSKISILEDLSDRTDVQVHQLIQILDERGKLLQAKVLKAEESLAKIEQARVRSLEVAKIFQDKIPHNEYIERQQTTKYVKAALMANEGKSIDEISQTLEIPRSEVDLIVKVNKNELSFDPNFLPDWIGPSDLAQLPSKDSARATLGFQMQKPDLSGLAMAKQNFVEAVSHHQEQEKASEARIQKMEETMDLAVQKVEETAKAMKTFTENVVKNSTNKVIAAAQNAGPAIRKVQFPRINL
jgi:hypothetical protein